MSEEQEKKEQQPVEQPKKRGCFFYGCLILVVLMVIVIGAVAFGAYYTYNKILEFTDDKPAVLPKVEVTEGESSEIKSKIDAFREAIRSGQPAQILSLSGKNINSLVEEDPAMKGKLYISIEGNEIKGQVSIPLEKFKGFENRFLNGSASFKVSLEDGVLIVNIESLEVKGKPIPEVFMEELRKQNLAAELYKNPEHAELIRKFESIEIKDGAITFKAKEKKE